MKKLKKYIGDKAFYKTVFALIIPIMIQQLFISIAGYVDSLMITNYGEASLAYNGVSAANKIMFVFNFIWLGVSAVGGIFISQYHGAKNQEKAKESLRFVTYVSLLFGIIGGIVVLLFGNLIVDNYVLSTVSRQYGYDYLRYMVVGSVITSLTICFSTSFRSIKKPSIALIASTIGIFINVLLNYTLIFGHFGFKEMGSGGASLATVISRVVELIIYIVILFFNKKSYFYQAFNKLKVSKKVMKEYIKKGIPLILNEFLWSLGMILLAKFYTYKNDDWYSAYSYSQNISDLFFIIFAGLGNGTAIVIGSSLGSNDFEKAQKYQKYFKGLAIIMGVSVGILMTIFAPFIIKLFNLSGDVRILAIRLLQVTAFFTAVYCYNSVDFFTLRSGGDSIHAFLVDQLPTYLITLPIAIVLGVNARRWDLSIVFIMIMTHLGDIFKMFLADYFVSKKKWVVNLAKKPESTNLNINTTVTE